LYIKPFLDELRGTSLFLHPLKKELYSLDELDESFTIFQTQCYRNYELDESFTIFQIQCYRNYSFRLTRA
jgi:hypothetical protein